MKCPGCGQDVDDGAVICAGCDYILDTSFLGDDITDDRPPSARAPSYGGDALILGDVTNDFAEVLNEETGSYLTAATGAASGPMRAAPVYVDANTAQLTDGAAVLGRRDAVTAPLTPFEEHVLSFLDGERSVDEVRDASGLSMDDVKIAICMLAEKGLVGLRAQSADDADATDMDARLPAAVLSDARRGRVTSSPPSSSSPSPPSSPPPSSSGERRAEPAAAPRTPPRTPPRASPRASPRAPLIVDDELPTTRTPSLRTAPPHTSAEAPRTVASPPPSASEQRAITGSRPAVSSVNRVKARGVFELALKDINAGRHARARMYAKLAASLDPSEKRYQDLLEHWDKAEKMAAKSGPVSDDVRLFNEAEAAERAGDFKKAAQLLRQAIAQNPESGALHNRLGVVLATRFKDFTAAMSSLFAAVELEPDNANFKHNLAKVLAAAEGKSSANFNIDELLSGTGQFDVKKAEAVGKRDKSSWTNAFKKKLF